MSPQKIIAKWKFFQRVSKTSFAKTRCFGVSLERA